MTLLYTEKDKERERMAAELVRKHWGVECTAFDGETSPYDLYVNHGKTLLAICEVKDHYINQADNRNENGYERCKFFSLRKWTDVRVAAMGAQVPAFLIVEFADGFFWVSLNALTPGWKVSINGRKDRNRQNDWEPGFWIPFTEFAPMKERPEDVPQP